MVYYSGNSDLSGFQMSMIIGSGATVNVHNGPDNRLYNTQVISGGTLNIAQASIYTMDVSNGGVLNVATAVDSTIEMPTVILSLTINGGSANIGNIQNSSVPPPSLSNTIITNGGVLNITNVILYSSLLNGGIINVGDKAALDGYMTSVITGNINILSGGQISSVDLGSNTSLTISNGGLATHNILSSNTVMVVDSGGVAQNNSIFGGTFYSVGTSVSGTTESNSVISTPGATVVVSSGGLLLSNYINSGAVVSLMSGGSAVGNTLYGGVSITVDSGAYISDSYISNGSLLIAQGGDVKNTTIGSGAIVNISNQGVAAANTVESGGILNLDHARSNNSYNVIENGGIINADSSPLLSTTIESGGILNLTVTSADNTILSDGGIMNVYQGATLNSDSFSAGTINVYSNAIVSNAVVDSSAIMNVYSSGTTSNISIASGGTVNFYSGGRIPLTYVLDGGILNLKGGDKGLVYVSQGGVVNVSAGFLPVMYDGGIVNISNPSYDGSTTSNLATAEINMDSAAELNIGYGASVYMYLYEGGIINIKSGGNLSSLRYGGYGKAGDVVNIYSGGSLQGDSYLYNIALNILSGGSADTVTFTQSGVLTVDGSVNSVNLGVLLDSGGAMYGGSAIINSGGVVSSLIAYNSASALFNSGAFLTGNLTLNDGAKVTITTSTGGTIDLIGDTNAGLTIYGSAAAGQNTSVTTTINGFSGVESGNSDSITLANINQNDITNVTFPDNDHITLILSDNSSITLNIPNIKTTGYSLGTNGSNGLILQVCFLTGTMIEIPGGVCAVEDLKVGDSVLVYDRISQKKISVSITWIGHKITSVKPNLHHDEAGYPVRILKDAIAQNVPNKDLLITAEHCLYFDGKLIPARMLVNGYSIYYDTSVTSYEYYHIETAEHSILTADGMLTESYLDTGNRHQFNLDHKVIELSGDKVKTWQNDAIVPLVTEGSIVERIYSYLLQRAHVNGCSQQEQSFELTQDPDICLMTDQGEIIYKEASSTDKKLSFIIPNNVSAVWILSRTSRPCDVIGAFVDDRRYLGVLVGEVALQRNGKKHQITTHLDADHLLGWDVQETIPCRWTKGKAFLPLDIESQSKISNLLTLEILSDHAYIIDQSKESNKKRA